LRPDIAFGSTPEAKPLAARDLRLTSRIADDLGPHLGSLLGEKNSHTIVIEQLHCHLVKFLGRK
jgi:hypothetical protein